MHSDAPNAAAVERKERSIWLFLEAFLSDQGMGAAGACFGPAETSRSPSAKLAPASPDVNVWLGDRLADQAVRAGFFD
jgi:hypothetical protein